MGVPRQSYLSAAQFPSAGVPVICVTTDEVFEKESEVEYENILPLPASKYRYSRWSELNETDVTSDMLRCPRIRKAPNGFKVDTILMLEEQELENAQSSRQARRKKWGRSKKKEYTNKLENWEACEYVNLSYQNLGHTYQMKEFIKVLKKLIRAEMIELIENTLTDLSSVFFPRCKYLFLQRNSFKDLKKLPKLNNIEHISLQQNNITSLRGLEVLRETTIRSLVLRDNPVTLQKDYRKTVFQVLPQLVLLDELPRDGNSSNSQSQVVNGMCNIT